MKLTDLETQVRLAVPGANTSVIDSPSLWNYINKGVDDINERLKIRQTDTKIASVAAQAIYTISTLISDFVCMDENGIYYNTGTVASPSWQQLIPKTMKWLDENVYSWRNYTSGTPIYYCRRNDTFIFVAAPSVSLSQAFWVYYIQRATAMTNGDQYPFVGTTVENPSYRCLDDGIIAYCQWKLEALLGNKAQGVMDRSTYLDILDTIEEVYLRNPDISNSRYFRMQGPSFGGRSK